MFKKILKGMVIGSAALTIAASAQAGTINVNLYGASAQYEFWTAAAPSFLTSLGCDAANLRSAKGKVSSRDTGAAVCLGDQAVQPGGDTGEGIGGNTVVIRYTTEASYDGIRAVMADTAYDPDGCGSANRKQADLTSATLPTTGVGTVTALSCQDVHIGASDVAATTFNQKSEGYKLGHLGGPYLNQEIIFPDALQDPQAAGYNVDRPIVVPFGFFANNGRNVDYSTTPATTTVAPEKAVPFDNMSRLMATSLYSGQVSNWNEFDPSLPPQRVTLCLRHAGSGTAATLDAAVMRGDYNLVIKEYTGSNASRPKIYFNNGSSDMVKCVGENFGAVGYADADKCVSGCSGVKSMTYQGVAANSTNIKNGQYDFWAAQWLYNNEIGDTKALIDELVLFASDEANLPSSKAEYWASQDAMNWEKADDFQYPKQK